MNPIAKKVKRIEGTAPTSKFLYIGNDSLLKLHLTKIFKEGTVANDFSQAVRLIRDNGQNDSYAIIFIDTAFQIDKIKFFSNFVTQHKHLFSAVIIYNIKKVGANFDALKQFQLVDDVFDLATDKSLLQERIHFLIRSKQADSSLKNRRNAATFESVLFQSRFISKRIIDLAVASFALIILAPVFLLIAVIIKIDSKGPIIYTSSRAGKGFKIFQFYKFRTMEVNADKKIDALAHLNQYDVDSSGPRFFKINNDPRITTFGKFLRNTSLDELPQLFNVILGDMSLVGNRPLPLYEAATLTTNEYVERFMAPSGITGLWQIKKRGKPQMSTQERVALDIVYAKKYNLFYDMWIMCKTPAALFQKTSV